MADLTKEESFKLLEAMGCFEYGATTKLSTIYKAFNIDEVEYPATRADIQTASLAELMATDYIRAKLLNRGKYLKGERDSYRVLLPSENAGQVLAYMKAADGKLKRGLKLNRNTPVQYKVNSQDEVRIMMKSDDIKDKIK